MKILLARTAGFCMGVRRAVDKALEKSRGVKPIWTLGPLIHNPQIVEMLESRNIHAISGPDEADSGIIIIRAHGVTPAVKEEIEQSGLEYCDVTCPLVIRIQRLITRYVRDGYSIVIVGDKGHAEVVALMGYTDGKGVVVESRDDIADVPEGPLCIVVQSTQNHEFFDEVVSLLRKRDVEIKVFDTICSATTARQEEVRELAGRVDAMVVVGGKNSANTRRLADIALSIGVPTFAVETEAELDEKNIGGFGLIAVTAGASTPNWLIERVTDRLREIQRRSTRGLAHLVLTISNALLKTDSYTAFGAAVLCFVSAGLQSLRAPYVSALIGLFYVFSVHLLNHFTDKEYFRYKESHKVAFLQGHQFGLVILGVLSAASALVISALLGLVPFIIILSATFLGLLYGIRIVPRKISNITRIKKLRDFPASRNFAVAISWATVTAIIPLFEADSGFGLGTAVAFLFVFTLVFTRSALMDMRDIQGDMMLGNETIPILIGQRTTNLLLVILLGLSALALTAGSILGWVTGMGFFMVVPLTYALGYLYLLRRRFMRQGIYCEAIADSQYYLAGLIAVLWYLF